jgi:hypothetical protein
MGQMDEETVIGDMAAYGLSEWWLSAFTDEEREYIDNRYQTMGGRSHSLTQGERYKTTYPATKFLNELSSWFRSKDDTSIRMRIHEKVIELGNSNPVKKKPGYYQGRHYTTYVQDVEALKKEKKLDEAEYLLLALIKAVEAQARHEPSGVIAPWYYKELAKVYHKQKDYTGEIAILERYINAGGFEKPIIREMLEKARRMKAENESHHLPDEVK